MIFGLQNKNHYLRPHFSLWYKFEGSGEWRLRASRQADIRGIGGLASSLITATASVSQGSVRATERLRRTIQDNERYILQWTR